MLTDRIDALLLLAESPVEDSAEIECQRCGSLCCVRDGYEPTAFCDLCAQTTLHEMTSAIRAARAEIERLQSQIAAMKQAAAPFVEGQFEDEAR